MSDFWGQVIKGITAALRWLGSLTRGEVSHCDIGALERPYQENHGWVTKAFCQQLAQIY